MVRLHPSSLVVGALGAVLVFVCMSQITTPVSFPSGRFQFGPHPRDFVRIQEGTPYTVPAGKVLVVTALGGPRPTGTPAATLVVNGVSVLSTYANGYYGAPVTVRPAPRMTVAHGGDLVAVVSTYAPHDCLAWGYVADSAPLLSPGTMRPALELQPHPQDVFAVDEGTPFIVPPGMLAVVTALGTRQPTTIGQNVETRLLVNGHDDVACSTNLSEWSLGTQSDLPRGFVYGPGTTIEPRVTFSIGFTGRALCYLAAQ